MRILNIDTKIKMLEVEDWPAPYGKLTKEVRIGQFVFVNAYCCTGHPNKAQVTFDHVINLTPSVQFDRMKKYRKRSEFIYI